MGKKLIAIIASVAIILATVNVEVLASETCSILCYPYTVSGSCSISRYSAGASTSATPMSKVEVNADYVYVDNYDSGQPNFHYWSKSNGGRLFNFCKF